MFKIKSATRLALTVGIGCASLIWLAAALGLIEDPAQTELKKRVSLAKFVAVSVTTFAENKRSHDLKVILDRVVTTESDLVSIGVRRRGRSGYVAIAGPHQQEWQTNSTNANASGQITVEILANGSSWGNLEVRFVENEKSTAYYGLLAFPFTLAIFIASSTALLTWGVLGKTFRYLNPSNVVPDRVRSAFDTLAEGLVLVDPSGEIAHCNQSFSTIVEQTPEMLIGTQIDSLNWRSTDSSNNKAFPWAECLASEERVCGEILELQIEGKPRRKFVVNATPIHGSNGTFKGVLTSLDDVTAMEQKNAELAKMIQTLRNSRDEVTRQNEKLNFLASYDTLTKCINRRVFFSKFETYWDDATCTQLSLIMLDVDHFKLINDNHGHSVGDEVLQAMGETLREQFGEQGIVCRYGGEEFVVLLPNMSIDDACSLADAVRQGIEAVEVAGVRFTVSLGVSCLDFKPMDMQHMLDQADESLYIAKNHGRNQVVRYDERSNYENSRGESTEEAETEDDIPYSAVTGLLSALSFRCPVTAAHSIRVADLSVALGEKMMSKRELYRLEISALLHDVGKIGVPDSVLNKPGPLNAAEWEVMRKHDAIGVEIIRSSFASESVALAIESHHDRVTAQAGGQNGLDSSEMSTAAKIITVCDAYDSMTNDRAYRKAMSEFDALQELVRNTPTQFDPSIVELLVHHIEAGHHRRACEVATPIEVRDTGTKSVAAVGKYIEELYNAIEDRDLEGLEAIVQRLEKEAAQAKPMREAIEKVKRAITEEQELDEVLELASGIIAICRSTRSLLLSSTNSPREQTVEVTL